MMNGVFKEYRKKRKNKTWAKKKRISSAPNETMHSNESFDKNV